MRNAVLASVAAALLAGCVSLLPEPPPAPRVYTLRVGGVEKSAAAPRNIVAVVGAPDMPRMAAGADIVWREGAEVAVMDGVAWDDSAPDLLQAMLAETLDRRGVFRAVVRSGAGARGDLDMRWDVLAFEIVEDGRIEAALSANVRLIDARTRTIVDVRRFEARAPVASRSARVAVAALQQAARDLCLQITDWAAERAPEPSPPPLLSGQSGPPGQSGALSQPSAASTRR